MQPTQPPTEHTSPAAHALPHLPQFLGSCARSVHWPLHSAGSRPLVQAHAPLAHCSPPVHALPHLPQFALSVVVSVHLPMLHEV